MSFPRIDITEIDLSQPSIIAPVFAGTPAAVIGTAQGGRAFVPTRLNSLQMYRDNFGDISSRHAGSVAVRSWYSEAEADAGLIYIRLLGVGKGEKRTTNNVVEGAGFIVGEQQVQSQVARNAALEAYRPTVGSKTHNPFASQIYQKTASVAATATITIDDAGSALAAGTISLITAGGDTILITGGASGSGDTMTTTSGASSDGVFEAGDTVSNDPSSNNVTQAGHIATCLNLHDDITATNSGTAVVTITQNTAGAAGNTDITISSGDMTTATTVVDFGDGSTTPGVNEIQSSPGLGRTYFLSCFMSQSAGSTYFDDAGIRGIGTHANILRGVILVASGVEMALSGWNPDSDGAAVPTTDTTEQSITYGTQTGSLHAWGSYAVGHNFGNTVGALYQPANAQTISFIFNGKRDESSRVIPASLNPGLTSSYIGAVLNTDPTLFERTGHYLYAHYPVPVDLAIPTPLNTTDADGGILKTTEASTNGGKTVYHNVMLHTGSGARNAYSSGATYVSNWEGWQDRFSTPFTPWIVSQPIGGAQKKLFRIHALDDGEGPADFYYGVVSNVTFPNVDGEYGVFDLKIYQIGKAAAGVITKLPVGNRTLNSSDNTPAMSFNNLSLDPNSPNYIGKKIGDTHVYFDFEKNPEDQKLVKSGLYPNTNAYFRVEVAPDVANSVIDADTVPFGFQGINHLVTSGSSQFAAHEVQTCSFGGSSVEILTDDSDANDKYGSGPTGAYQGVIQPPLPFRETLQKSKDGLDDDGTDYAWGVRFDIPLMQTHYKNSNNGTWTATYSYDESQKLIGNSSTKKWDLSRQLTKFFPSYQPSYPSWVGDNTGTAEDSTGGILDADVFNNNGFSLSKILVATKTVNSNVIPDNDRWGHARYIRSGIDPSESGYRFLEASDFRDDRSGGPLAPTSFVVPFQGGFDGLNIFDINASKMNNFSAHFQQENVSAQGGKAGSVVGPYRKAIDILSEKTDVDISALCIPDQRCSFVTDYAMSKMEERFDAIAILDPELMDSEGSTTSNIMFDTLEDQDGYIMGMSAFYTAERFGSRGLDSSFAAAYFPNVDLAYDVGLPSYQSFEDQAGSIAALAAFARAKKITGDHGVPAGYKNGAISNATETTAVLQPDDVKELYAVGVNAIVHHTDSSGANAPQAAEIQSNIVIFGQKTLLRANTVMSRLDVRKLLIAIRRRTRQIAMNYLFEPNQPSVLQAFSSDVDNYLSGLQSQGAVQQYRVVIDETTTSQADIENNTVRGKVFVQPIGSVEIISLDLGIVNDFEE